MVTSSEGKKAVENFTQEFEELCQKSAINKRTDAGLKSIRENFANASIEVYKLLKDNLSWDEQERLTEVLTNQGTTSIFSGKRLPTRSFY